MGIAAPGRPDFHVVSVAGPAERSGTTRQAIRAGALAVRAAGVALLLAAAAFAPERALATPRVPAGFVVENVAGNATFESPTAVAALPDGRLIVTEQGGRVWMIENGVLRPTPVWDAQDEVLNSLESGLVGIAVDPAYATNHYLYLYYTVDPDSDGVDDNVGAFGRLTRYQMRTDGSETVDPASRTILMGTTWADAPITGIDTHTVGTLRWGSDGSLLVSHGDGDNWNVMDAGGLYPDVFAPGRADPNMDIGAYRSQSISSLNGKILRLDPATGLGLPSNPYFDGDPASNRSKVFAYGLRNPFRFGVRPGTGDPDPAHGNPGVLYVGDVGWFRWEELDVVDQAGMNFGWPVIEGLLPEVEYSAAAPFRLGPDSVGVTPDDPTGTSLPVSVWSHAVAGAGVPSGFTGGASVGGVFYTGSLYPPQYRGRYFHADYGAAGGWIRAATMTPDNRLISFDSFGTAMDAPVDLELEPQTGNLLYVSYFMGEVRRIRWAGDPSGPTLPVAFGRAQPLLGVAPLAVQLLADGSYDPDGGALAVHWDFGDGASSDGIEDPIHTYASPGAWLATLTVTNASLATDRDTFTVVVTAQPVLPTTDVLDDFQRPDGALEAPWLLDQPGLSVLDGTLTQSGGESRALWNGAEFGSTQEVWATIGPEAASASRVALLLKAQGLGATDARVEVSYLPGQGCVLVTTDDLAFGTISRGAPIPVAFVPGTRFGARCTANGRIEVFANGSRIGSRSITGWPAVAAPGQIGVWIDRSAGGASPSKPGEKPRSFSLIPTRPDPHPVTPSLPLAGPLTGVLDDFGGGDTFVPGNRPPVVNIASPADSSFFDGLSAISLAGSATDPEDPADSLVYRWVVTRHHTNHTDPSLTFAGTSASFTPVDPGSEPGTWYEVKFIATDPEGSVDSSRALLFPRSDLEVGGLVANTDHIGPGTPAELGFWISNRGPLISTRSFWRALLDQTSLEMNPIVIAGGDSVYFQIALPASMAAGPHLVRVVADTLQQCVETDEANNVAELAFDWPAANVGVEGALPRTLALSSPMPNPSPGAVRFRLDLPQAATVAMEVHDLQGRTVFADRGRSFGAGRWDVEWDGRGEGGGPAPPGVYLARVRAGGQVFARRIALVR